LGLKGLVVVVVVVVVHFILTPPVIISIEGDMLENIEIGQQKQRDDAYKAARKKETYDDK
jgi:hypothetical protein